MPLHCVAGRWFPPAGFMAPCPYVFSKAELQRLVAYADARGVQVGGRVAWDSGGVPCILVTIGDATIVAVG